MHSQHRSRSTQLTGQARSDYHRNMRRPSTNDSHTIRHFNQDGIVDYCYVMHESWHGHGYIEEFILTAHGLIHRLTHEHGGVSVRNIPDVTAWIRSQRMELLMT